MHFQVDQKIFEQYQDFKLGVILVKGMSNSRRISSVESLLRGICAQRSREFVNKELDEESRLRVWNFAYGNFGINPQKFLPSVARLAVKVKTGKEVAHRNSLADICNYFSLKYLLPLHAHDLDWLCGDLQLLFTKGGEAFRPIHSIEIEHAKEGEVAYLDQGGITTRFWNHLECERTKLTERTVNAAIFIEDMSKIHMDEFGRILQEIESTISKYIGGQIEIYLLNPENNSLDLGIAGRKNADDSRVPQQEKAHFIEKQIKDGIV